MCEQYLNEKPSKFWKSWNAKIPSNMNKNVVTEGCESDQDISKRFAVHFANIYQQHVSKRSTFDVAYDATCAAGKAR
jgi:hypothetical protein